MKSILFPALLLFATLVQAQSLVVNTFGDPADPALIFLHGGPGYNSVPFERTTAEPLAQAGFFVLSYDRRGEGRSTKAAARYTFEETIQDLDSLYLRFGLERATLLGHSFGGMVATLFAERHPEKVKALVLISAPVALQETFQTIITTSTALYEERQDSANLKYMAMLAAMDPTSLMYSSYSFMHAMQNGFYSTDNPTEAAQELYARFATDSLLIQYASQMGYAAPMGFWQNEQYTSLDLTAQLEQLRATGIPIFGLYGQEDGLYSTQQVLALQRLIGKANLRYYDRCSHNVFIDRQAAFVAQLRGWLLE